MYSVGFASFFVITLCLYCRGVTGLRKMQGTKEIKRGEVENVKGKRQVDDALMSTMITKTAVLGHTVNLPCNVTSPLRGDSMTLVLWYKGLSEVPLYSLDARSGLTDIFSPEHIIDDSLRSRASFRVKTNPPVLVISHVASKDEGLYTCRVDFRQARSINHNVKLLVIIPPEKPRITDENEGELSGVIGPFNEGDPLRVFCSVKKGRPRPSLKWILPNGKVIDDLAQRQRDGSIVNELTIEKLGREHVDTRIMCQAMNNNITNPALSYITINLNLKPSEVRITTDKKPVSAGKSTRLECRCLGSRPDAVISWWKGNEKMMTSEEVPSPTRGISNSVVTFVPAATDNKKFVACRCENPSMSGSAIEEGWSVDVYFKPKLNLKAGKNVNLEQIREGNDFYFQCESQSNPPVKKFEWYFEGKRIYQNQNENVLLHDNMLVLQEVKRQRKGRYKCSARNEEGTGVSNSFNLRIKHVPACVDIVPKVYYVSLYEEAKILCEVDADPSVKSFTWTFENAYDKFNIIKHSKTGTRSIGFYTPRSDREYGRVLCSASNDIGDQVEPCAFIIKHAEPPEAVSNCSLTNRTVNTLSVVCDAGHDGGLLQTFIMEVFDPINNVLHANVSTANAPDFFAQNLPPNTRFLIKIYSKNKKGSSDIETVHTETLSLPSRADPENMFVINPLLGILIGVVITLVLMALMIILFMRYRNKKTNKALRAMDTKENDRVHFGNSKVNCFAEVKAKNPDVIPPTNSYPDSGYGDCDEHSMLKNKGLTGGVVVTGSYPPPYGNEFCKLIYHKHPPEKVIEGEENGEEVAYAELSLPKSKNSVVYTKPQTQYASIDFAKTATLVPSSNDNFNNHQQSVSDASSLVGENKRESRV